MRRDVIGPSRWEFPHSAPSGRTDGRSASGAGAVASLKRPFESFPGGVKERNQEAGMPYLLISTQIRLESGPTNVGDEFSDPEVMNYLGARKTTMLGNNFSEYHVDDPPRVVLDKLEKLGFRVLAMTGVGQTLVWCLHKELVE
uniref:GTP cyclohydrolase 1 feedback regulatory protein n=2 Tax=Nothobranchius korthausae TaxID=1143690 RepID=A0A1A8HAD4_9TELE